MKEFRSYSPEEVITANLRETAVRQSIVFEQEMAHLRELATEIAAGTGNGDMHELIASLPDHRPPRFAASPLQQNAEMLGHLQSVHAVWKSVLLCKEIGRQLSNGKVLTPELFFSDQEEIADEARNRIVYQRNGYADSAYLRFAESIPLPRAVYANSFPAVCEEVYNGNCEFCILPLENSAEGPLTGFTRLIDRYELKIAMTCDIPTTDGSRVTRFALLRRNLVPPVSFDDKELFFEFTAPLSEEPSTAELLAAAQCCGLQPCRLDSRTQQTDSGALPTVHFTFCTAGGDFAAFLLYLAMEAPHYEPVGIYLHLKEK
ncbi:MAG: hypothetical protein IJW55_03380 [Clostridia bacterium]|nr:hypothetical protein [Clostridia bacterium]